MSEAAVPRADGVQGQGSAEPRYFRVNVVPDCSQAAAVIGENDLVRMVGEKPPYLVLAAHIPGFGVTEVELELPLLTELPPLGGRSVKDAYRLFFPKGCLGAVEEQYRALSQ